MKQLGTITVLKGAKIRRTYETAAWYTVYEIDPGVYPVFDGGYFGSMRAEVTGTIVDEYMGTLYGGIHVGGPYEAPVGKKGSCVWSGYLKSDTECYGETEFIKFNKMEAA